MYIEPVGAKFGASNNSSARGNITNVYIPGAGFSGFYYILGRLHAIGTSTASDSYEYYCFSSGCLALVTSLMGVSVGSSVEMALASRNKMLAGEISQYELVNHFVDSLLFTQNATRNCITGIDAELTAGTIDVSDSNEGVNSMHYYSTENEDARQNGSISFPRFLSRMNVITSKWSADTLLCHDIQKPRSIDHLRELLIRTTWM